MAGTLSYQLWKLNYRSCGGQPDEITSPGSSVTSHVVRTFSLVEFFNSQLRMYGWGGRLKRLGTTLGSEATRPLSLFFSNPRPCVGLPLSLRVAAVVFIGRQNISV